MRMKQTLKDITVVHGEAMPIICDNTSAINISKNPVMHSKNKDIAIWYDLLKGKVVQKEVRLEYVPTKEQIANIFSKALAKDAFDYL